MNLTDRQVKLIEGLLITYCTYRSFIENECGKRKIKDFIFKGDVYKVLEVDYEKVCEIINYIKGVKE